MEEGSGMGWPWMVERVSDIQHGFGFYRWRVSVIGRVFVTFGVVDVHNNRCSATVLWWNRKIISPNRKRTEGIYCSERHLYRASGVHKNLHSKI